MKDLKGEEISEIEGKQAVIFFHTINNTVYHLYLDSLERFYKNTSFYAVDAMVEKDLVNKFNIKGTPHIIILSDKGEIIGRMASLSSNIIQFEDGITRYLANGR